MPHRARALEQRQLADGLDDRHPITVKSRREKAVKKSGLGFVRQRIHDSFGVGSHHLQDTMTCLGFVEALRNQRSEDRYDGLAFFKVCHG